ncbi:MAG: ABC transporter ATP-binding protein [Clostridia bacterium]
MKKFKLFFRGIREIGRICPGIITLISLRSIINALLPFINIYMSSVIVNAIVYGEPLEKLLWYAFLTVLLNAVCSVISAVLGALSGLRQASFSHLYEMHMAEKTMNLDFVDLENPETFQKKQRIQEIRNLNAGGLWKLLEVFPGIVNSGVSVVVSLSITVGLFLSAGYTGENLLLQTVISPFGSILLLILILLGTMAGIYTNAAVTKKLYTILEGFVSFNRIFDYYLNNYISTYHAGKDIRLYDQKTLIDNESTALFGEANSTFRQLTRNQVKYSGISTIASVVILAAVYLFVGLRAMAGLFAVGNILMYINSVNQFIAGINGCVNQFVALRMNQEALKTYFDYMDIPAHMKDGSQPVVVSETDPLEITFEDVSFHYPGSDQDVLQHLSFTFRTGRRTAIVGKNGSGKTTMIKLLCRLYDPSEGRIMLNGIDIRRLRYQEYISLFSVVFQDYKLMAFSLGQNVASSVEYDEDSATASLDMAGFGERLSQMRCRLETPLYKDFDEDGVEISGGEAQKIAIARALYKKAPFIILDEPTAALDPIAEAEVFQQFDQIADKKTAVYISHRLSTCRFCDEIMVFSEGKLVQRGTHEELLSDKEGLYQELWNAQAGYYTERC